MLATDHLPLDVAAFLAWVADRRERYELVRGAPLRMMTGTKQSHNVVVGNIADAMRAAAKARTCRTTTSDTAVATSKHSVRYPDIVVDCGPPDPDALVASCPTIIVEVLSPSTSQIDLTDKIEEYQALASLRVILLVEPDVVFVKLYRRDGGGARTVEHYDDMEERIALPEIGTNLPLAVIYDTLAPKRRPRLESLRRLDSPETVSRDGDAAFPLPSRERVVAERSGEGELPLGWRSVTPSSACRHLLPTREKDATSAVGTPFGRPRTQHGRSNAAGGR